MPLYDCSNYDSRTIGSVLDFQAKQRPERIWLRAGEASVTFAEARELVLCYGSLLRERGLREGSVVASFMPPSADTVLLFVATAVSGGMFAAIDTELSGDMLRNRLRGSSASIVVTTAAFRDRVVSALGEDAEVEVVVVLPHEWEALRAAARAVELPCGEFAAKPGDPAIMWWTSGTTGEPKGVVHTHSSALYVSWLGAHRHCDDEVWYCCTPMYLGGAWFAAVLPTLVSGTTVAIDERFSVSAYWDRIRHYGATSALLLGAMSTYILAAKERPDDKDNTLRTARCIPITYENACAFKERFGVDEVIQAYGMSETGPIFVLDPSLPWNDGTIGRPLGHFDIKLVDEFDREVEPGKPGELCVRPKHPDIMFAGYFGNPQATLDASRNWWFHCGDNVCERPDGTFVFYSRKKDYIRHKGRNVSLHQLDEIAARFEGLLECASFGVPADDAASEEEIALAVVWRKGAARGFVDLLDFIGEHGPYYLIPRYVFVLDDLPKNKHGRVVKRDLRGICGGMQPWDSRAAGFSGRRGARMS